MPPKRHPFRVKAELEIKTCAKLEDTRVRGCSRCRYQSKVVAVYIQVGRLRKNGFIQYVERFHSKLEADCFIETDVLAYTGVPVKEGRSVDEVARQISGRGGAAGVVEKEDLAGEALVPSGLARGRWSAKPAGSDVFRSKPCRTSPVVVFVMIAFKTLGFIK